MSILLRVFRSFLVTEPCAFCAVNDMQRICSWCFEDITCTQILDAILQPSVKYCSLLIAMLNCVVVAFGSVKVIARVNKEQAETQCAGDRSHGPGPQTDNEVYLNKMLLTEAIRRSLDHLQQVRDHLPLLNT